jgi:hypothetical protein
MAPASESGLRVCIYGGTNLQKTKAGLITRLACEILQKTDWIIVTGGYLLPETWDNNEPRISTDQAALIGAKEAGKKLKERFEAWLPASHLDRTDQGGAVRMSEDEHGVAVVSMEQRSALGRRLAMVRHVDMVITISGKVETNLVLEQALETNTPALPISFVEDERGEDDSKDFWESRKDAVAEWFHLTEEDVNFLDALTAENVSKNVAGSAERVLEILRKARVGSCLVIMKFDDSGKKLYSDIIKPTVSEFMNPDRLDERPTSGAIRSSFFDAVERSRAIIAEVSSIDTSPALAYEIGYAHARGIEPLLVAEQIPKELPVYMRELNVKTYSSNNELKKLIRDFLEKIKNA